LKYIFIRSKTVKCLLTMTQKWSENFTYLGIIFFLVLLVNREMLFL